MKLTGKTESYGEAIEEAASISVSQSVLERARRYIAKCPGAVNGQGGHNATYHVAAVLVHGFDLTEADAMLLLRDWNRSCRPPWSDADLLHKLRSAANASHLQPRGHLLVTERAKAAAPGAKGRAVAATTLPPPKPVFRPMVLKRVAAKTGAIANVYTYAMTASPVPVHGQDSASVLRWLYPKGSGEKVLIFSDMKSQGQLLWEANKGGTILSCQLPEGPQGVWFLPQPVDGEFHPNPRLGGIMSRRSQESVTAWRYAVLESDEADGDDWLRCLVQMPLRIACICESGGRSIHALVRIDAASKGDWDAKVGTIKPVMVTLGADAGALSAVRLTRLPQAKRGERVQRLLYLNPDPDGAPIVGRSIKMKGTQ